MRSDTLRRLAPLCLAAAVCAAAAEEAPLTLAGPAAYHGVHVPLSVMARTRYADLRDLRVVNGRGEAVPHAWADELPATEVRESRRAVPFFKAPAAASAAADGGRGGWIIDTRAVKEAMVQLRLHAPDSSQGIHGFALEYSDNLQQWAVFTNSAQWVVLQRDGERLEHAAFDLGGLRSRYLRLRPLAGQTPMPLTAVHVVSVDHHQPAAPLQWSEPLTPACNAEACDYTLPRHLPLERLSWQLASGPVVAPVSLLVRFDRGDAAVVTTPAHRKRDRLRDRLMGVRNKSEPAPTAPPEHWVPLTRTTLYRLPAPGGDTQTPDMLLDAGVVTQLRVVPKGGVAQLGGTPPVLRVGARAASLVFLAREPAPYRLVWGGDVSSAAVTLSELMPTRQAGAPLPQATAEVSPDWKPVMAAPQARPTSSPARAASAPAPGGRMFWLWAVLVAAAGLMGFMAWSLLRPTQAPGSADQTTGP